MVPQTNFHLYIKDKRLPSHLCLQVRFMDQIKMKVKREQEREKKKKKKIDEKRLKHERKEKKEKSGDKKKE